MQKVKDLAQLAAENDSTILITGETGTGKEVLAKFIHQKSNRSGPIVAVNCGAIPENLIESELFGHEKGSFTSATSNRKGRFELADKGTIFLDEIGDMPPNLQVKILRVLQERSFERVGGTETIKVNIRVIAATHRQLPQLIRDKKFREDLFYRLRVIELKVPPLRERRDEIPELAKRFVSNFSGKRSRPLITISDQALQALTDFNWPGNVRELENVIEGVVAVLPRDRISIETFDLPSELGLAKPADSEQGLTEMQQRRLNAYIESGFKWAKTARLLTSLEGKPITRQAVCKWFNENAIVKNLADMEKGRYDRARQGEEAKLRGILPPPPTTTSTPEF